MITSSFLYICSIFGTSLGFWKLYSKEQERKIKNIRGYKVLLLLLCLILSVFLYVRTCHVATLKNIVTIKEFKGSFDERGKEHRDSVESILFFAKLANKKWQEIIYLPNMAENPYSSGLEIYLKLNNDSTSHQYYMKNGKAIVDDTPDSLKHKYGLAYAASAIPTLFPFLATGPNSFSTNDSTLVNTVLKEKDINNIYDIIDDDWDFYVSHDNKKLLTKETNYGVHISDLFYTYNNEIKSTNDSHFITWAYIPKINNLSIFSLADLSQCNFEFQLKSDIPIKRLSLILDVPADFSSLDVVRDKVTYNGFTWDNQEFLNKHDGVFLVHAKLPTQENLQLIRSLVLTTIITGLITMFLTNCYYYFRKKLTWYKNRKLGKSNWRRKLRHRYLWNVIGHRLAIFVSVLLIIWIILLFTDTFIRIPIERYTSVCLGVIIATIIVFLIVSISYYRYHRLIKARNQILINKKNVSIDQPTPKEQIQNLPKTPNESTEENISIEHPPKKEQIQNRPKTQNESTKEKDVPKRKRGRPKKQSNTETT